MFSKQVAKMAKQAKVLAKKKFYQVFSMALPPAKREKRTSEEDDM